MPDSKDSQQDNLYETVLAAAGRAEVAPSRPPRPSASVVLWRRREGKVETFWIRRATTMAFMGGWHAFPGGGLSRKDAAIPVSGAPAGAAEAEPRAAMPESLTEGLDELPPVLAEGIVTCALRELLEETGVLPLAELFAGAGDAADLESRLGEARRALLAKDKPFAELLRDHALELNASRLVFAGRWLTPPLGPMRFDNRFFLLEWPAELPVQPLVIPGEAEHGEWIEPAAAFDRWRDGEVITAPPILHLLKVLAQDGPEDGLGRLREPEEANLGPYRRIEFRPDVIQLPLRTLTLPPASHTNAFLFGASQRLLVDPGSDDPREIQRLVEATQALEAGGETVVAIALTHHHPDHVAGVEPLREVLDLPVWAHALTAQRLEPLGISVNRHLEDGELLELGGDRPCRIQVVHTPGHAQGHLCFVDEERNVALVGDLISAVSTIVIDPPEGDMDQYLSSLEAMAERDLGTLFPAHGPPLLNGKARLLKVIQHRLWREERIIAAWGEGLRTPAELRPRVYEDIPPMVYPLAERQVRAHLERLLRAGRVG